MLHSKLFGEKTTPAQQAVVGLWFAGLLLVVGIWANGSIIMPDMTGLAAKILMSVGELFGVLATYFALVQFMLMGRVRWIERPFGLDHLTNFHRLNGYGTIVCILIHPLLITASYALSDHENYIQQYGDLVLHFSYVWLALIGELLFILVVATTVYIVRKHLKFESWYFVHLSVYAAIVLVFFHQLALGDSFLGHPLNRILWYGLYLFVVLNVLFWRFSLPTLRSLFFGFKVSKVVAETPTTTSVYISLNHFKYWKSLPGQFVLVRIFSQRLWWQEHPFSLSMIPHDGQLRLTIRNVGDYTAMIAELKPGKRILLSGPFGRFTSEITQTSKRLFIAGGVGITPIRALAEEALAAKIPSKLIYANREPGDVVFKSELQELTHNGLVTTAVFSNPPSSYKGEAGYVNGALIARLIPDYKKYDIYLCGPPPMMSGIITDLQQANFPAGQLHFERFALHGN